MAYKINRANNVDFDKFSFGDVQVNKYGGKSSRVQYNGKDFYLQTPRLRLPYGLGAYQERNSDDEVIKVKYSLDFSFAGYEMDADGVPANTKVRELFDMMEGMEKLLAEKTVENCESWLGESGVDANSVKFMVRPLIKYSRDKVTKKITMKYPPTFKGKVGFWDDHFTVQAYNSEKEPVSDLISECPPGTEAVALVKLTGVNFAAGKAGYSFAVHQVKLYKPATMPAYAFLEDDDDEVPIRKPETQGEHVSHVSKSAPSLVESSEEDDDELDIESETEVEEPVQKVKKVVKKTKRKPKKST